MAEEKRVRRYRVEFQTAGAGVQGREHEADEFFYEDGHLALYRDGESVAVYRAGVWVCLVAVGEPTQG